MEYFKQTINLDISFPLYIDNQFHSAGYRMKSFHWHECLEISYVKSGYGRYNIENRFIEMNPGDIIILNNVEPHYLEVTENMNQMVMIFEPRLVWSDCSNSMDYEYLKPFFERGFDFNNRLESNDILGQPVRENLLEIEKEFSQKSEGYHLMIKARLLMLLTYLLRFYRDKDKLGFNGASKTQCLLRIGEVLKYISANYSNELRLEEVSAMMHVSPQYFSTFFKKVTGSNFIDYVNNLRINKSIRMLTDTDNKITLIAQECGFNNTSNFNNVFKKFTGKTPSSFR